jgi:hypothetical protein
MKDKLRSESQAEIWGGGKIRENPFFCPVYFSAILSVVLMNQVEAGRPKTDGKKSEESEKRFFAIFQLEPSAAQYVPTKMSGGDFSDFSKNSRGYTRGEGVNESL